MAYADHGIGGQIWLMNRSVEPCLSDPFLAQLGARENERRSKCGLRRPYSQAGRDAVPQRIEGRDKAVLICPQPFFQELDL
jgi:hypothetical protein